MSLLDAFLSNVPVEALTVRMLTTALVVMAVSWAVGVFGPIIGGALAGLPIVHGAGQCAAYIRAHHIRAGFRAAFAGRTPPALSVM